VVAGVQAGFVAQYLELVRKVGVDLRSLLSTVDILVAVFPPAAHREVHFLLLDFVILLMRIVLIRLKWHTRC
jgi:Focal adhesion targeting region